MLTVTPIPAIKDNYFWLIQHSDNTAIILDPGDALPVLNILKERKLTLIAIVITHRHWDHVDGINDLLRYYDVPVYGPNSVRIPQITHALAEGDTLTLFNDKILQLGVIEIPGHTAEHIGYYGEINQQHCLFCGDTLFAAGCGRIATDGSAEQLYHSLQKINRLPAETQIFCSHEYTLSNLVFAQTVEPSNINIKNRLKNEQEKRGRQRPTLPTNLNIEQQTNPFLRCHIPEVADAINQYWQQNWEDEEALFVGLRRWKSIL